MRKKRLKKLDRPDQQIETLENAIKAIFKSKGEEVIQNNLEAFRAGLNFSLSNK